MMDKYENVKCLGLWVHPEAGFECLCYYDGKQRDWYAIRKEWTGGVIAVWPEDGNIVGSYCDQAESYVPIEGQTLYEVDRSTVPHKDDVMKLLGMFTFDGETFSPVSVDAPKERTKEDIMADLIKLQEELKALK
jgi:hypothetical protein